MATKKTTKKAVKRPVKKAAKKPTAAKPLALVPDAVEDPKEKRDETEAKPKLDKERASPTRPAGRPAIPKVGAVKFKPDSSLLHSVASHDEDKLRVILYGDQGTGKSTSLASLTERGRIVIVDPENSIRRGALKRRGYNVDNILLWPDWSYDGIQQLYVTMKAELEEDPNAFYALGFDSGSSLSEIWLEQAVRESLATLPMQRKHPDRNTLDVFQEDYGTLGEMFRQVIVRMFFTLPCHVIVTCHSKRSDNEVGQVMVGPALTPMVQNSLMTHADWVIRQTVGQTGQRKQETNPKGNILAKDRFGVLDSEMFDATLMDMVKVWEEEN